MKKTAQTLLTAAIFATALGSSAQSRMQQPAEALGDPIKEVETNLVDVYGPPSMFTTVLPEDTNASASPFRIIFCAMTIEESFFFRIAFTGCSAISITSLAGTI